MQLVIGDKSFSSWSLRPWMVLKHAGIDFTEVPVRLRLPTTADEIARHSPSGKIPTLHDGEVVVWDSLAICEYLADRFPEKTLWPADLATRAAGRSAAAEMHSGFPSVRGELSMDLAATPHVAEISDLTRDEIRRVVALWCSLRERYAPGGPFLLGAWSIADAFFTPVATRFRTYGVRLSDFGDLGMAGAYCEVLLEQPELHEWEAAAKAETSAT
jgi:glutathione S-transferase